VKAHQVPALTLKQAVHALVETPVLDDGRVHDVVVLENIPRSLDGAL